MRKSLNPMPKEKRQLIRQIIDNNGDKIKDIAEELKINAQSLSIWFDGKFNSKPIEQKLLAKYEKQLQDKQVSILY